MIKVRIHIKSDNEYMDKRAFIECELPCVPRKGDILWLPDSLQEELENKIKSDLEIAQDYCPYWFYGRSNNILDVTPESLEDFTLDDAIFVGAIRYVPNQEWVDIELSDC